MKAQRKLIGTTVVALAMTMKTVKSTARVALVAGMLLASAGCTVIKPTDVNPIQGIVWRVDIARQLAKFPSVIKTRSDLWVRRNATARLVTGEFFKDFTYAPVALADSMDFEDFERGAIVDIIMQRGDDRDGIVKLNRVIRLVCKGSDKECIKQEWASGRMNTMIDPNPPSDFSNGNTYVRHLSKEEWEKYD